jgi:phosphatidylinositol glycan class A protein
LHSPSVAILEAAACGLFVVSTRVGGVPEVLPPDMILFAEPTAESLIQAVSEAIPRAGLIDPNSFHERVAAAYSWDDVASRTEEVYAKVMRTPRLPLGERLAKYGRVGPFAGYVCIMLAAIDWLFLQLLEWMRPVDSIDIAADYHAPDPLLDPKLHPSVVNVHS